MSAPLKGKGLILESQQWHDIRAGEFYGPGCFDEYATEPQAVERQHQRKEAICRKRDMPAVGKGHVKISPSSASFLTSVRRKARIRDQRCQHRRKVAPFAVDLDAKRQFEPVGATALELRIECAGSGRQPIREIIIDADFKTFGPQLGSAMIEKVEPVAS